MGRRTFCRPRAVGVRRARLAGFGISIGCHGLQSLLVRGLLGNRGDADIAFSSISYAV